MRKEALRDVPSLEHPKGLPCILGNPLLWLSSQKFLAIYRIARMRLSELMLQAAFVYTEVSTSQDPR